MDPLEQLTNIFQKFPGIGPRQAGRFVQHLLRVSPSTRRALRDAVEALSDSVVQCPSCQRYHSGEKGVCALCSDMKRDLALLAIVASDSDLSALEKSSAYRGHYFVLGGTISLADEKAKLLRESELKKVLSKRMESGLREVILALPANPEGDFTALHLRGILDEFVTSRKITLSTLGRGLSTGSELEYADPETLKSALESRR